MFKFHYRESPTDKQKKTFAKYLSENEELVLVTGLGGAYLRQEFMIYCFFPGLVPAALGGLFLFSLGFSINWTIGVAVILMLIAALIKTLHLYHSHRYIFTNKRVMIKKGLLSVQLTTALYDKITHIEVDQGLIDRFLLHQGNIIVNTAGMNKSEFVLEYVDHPIELKNLLEKLINREREQMGRKYETLTTVEGEVVE